MGRSYRSKKKITTEIISVLVLAVILLLFKHFSSNKISDAFSEDVATNADLQDKLVISYIDVGQGDGALVTTPDGASMLIDAGPTSAGDDVVSYLESMGIESLDYAVFTHPHDDHIGGALDVIENIEIKNFIIPDCTHISKTYEKFLLAIDESGANVIFSEPDYSFDLGEASVKILSPIMGAYDELNYYSIVLKLTYGNNSFMFTGDAEKVNENEMLERYGSSVLSCDVLKVGHHGSSTSSSKDFIDAIAPAVAIISCAEGNEYGHPHRETNQLLSEKQITVFRTDIEGTVILVSDGETVQRLNTD